MNFTIYNSNLVGVSSNCIYPSKIEVNDLESLIKAVGFDHVCAEYKDNKRSVDNFISSNVLVMDIDNDSSGNEEDFITAEKLDELFPDIEYALVPSRHHLKEKGNHKAAPRYHMYFPISLVKDAGIYTKLKTILFNRYPFFDGNAIDAARFLYGSEFNKEDAIWHDGWAYIDEDLNEDLELLDDKDNSSYTSQIKEGSRNNTMSHFASRVLKKFGNSEKARQAFIERSENCNPPLSHEELKQIWNSALRFYNKKIVSSKGYISPDEYNDEFKTGYLMPSEYSEMDQAVVVKKICGEKLKYTIATDFITYIDNRWHEGDHIAVGAIEDFLDLQLSDANELVSQYEEAIIALGIDKKVVMKRKEEILDLLPQNKKALYYLLKSADQYKKFAIKNRNYKNVSGTLKMLKPKVALDISEFDLDAEYLNTPNGTYDLTKGLDGRHDHDPDDLITKITEAGPGEKGEKLWYDALDLFFCGDKDLIRYVKQIVGMAAFGKVYGEHLIIAYGGGANGKSTFWNTIARVLGSYSGKISAESLTSNCKHNVKPEVAELKGKRLIIASELEEGTRLNTAMVKQLSSTDPIEGEKKFKDPFKFEPSHTLVLYTNHLPRVSTNDDGTWRRLIVIPFNAKITGKSDIKNYSDYLFVNAKEAIMKWIIEGGKDACDANFKFELPSAVLNAINKYRDDNDWLGQFIEDYCDIGEDLFEKSGELYTAYRSACLSSGEYVRNSADFYGSLEKAGFIKLRKRNGRMIKGLKLKEGQEFLN